MPRSLYEHRQRHRRRTLQSRGARLLLVAMILLSGGCGDGSTTEVLRFGDGTIKQRKQLRRGLDGQLVADGPYTIYWPNGQKREEGHYAQGKKHGTVRLYYENGQLQGEGQFEHDQLIGLWTRWDEQGNPLPSAP